MIQKSEKIESTHSGHLRMQVLITALGRRGLESIASLPHPALPGVEYVVGWQFASDDPTEIPESLLERPDFKIIASPELGVAKNRNLLLDAASAPIILCSDDDVSYTPSHLESVIQAFDRNPDCTLLTFRYFSEGHPRPYPLEEADLHHPPKNYFAGAIEMAFRLDSLREHNIRFNEYFGIGSQFPAGEEDIILHDIKKAGLPAKFIPIDICSHPSPSTYMKEGQSDKITYTKGAILLHTNPITWPLRMLAHLLRARQSEPDCNSLHYCKTWLKGVRDAKRLNVFN